MTTLGPLSHKMTKPGAMVGPFSAAARNARARKPVPVKMLPARRSTKALLGGVDTGMMHGPALPKAAAEGMKMSMKSKIGIGLGLGVAATVAMNRRGQGASSGRQSMYRY